MTWTRRSSVARELPDTVTAGISSESMPTGAQAVSAPSPAENSGSDTSTQLNELIERTKQATADLRDARERLEADYDGSDREL